MAKLPNGSWTWYQAPARVIANAIAIAAMPRRSVRRVGVEGGRRPESAARIGTRAAVRAGTPAAIRAARSPIPPAIDQRPGEIDRAGFRRPVS